MAVYKQGANKVRVFDMVQSSDHRTPLTGATPVVNISKNGGSFAAAAGAVAEIANGYYKVTLTLIDTNVAGDLAFHITAASGDTLHFVDQIEAYMFTDLSIDATGRVYTVSNLKKNANLTGFIFVMTDSTTHAEKTGLTITAQRCKDGGSWQACTNSPVEISNGAYYINLTATDMNANTILLRFTATGADPLDMQLITQP